MMLGYVLGHHDAAPGPSWLGHGVEKLDVAGSGNWATDIHCGEARDSGPLWTLRRAARGKDTTVTVLHPVATRTGSAPMTGPGSDGLGSISGF